MKTRNLTLSVALTSLCGCATTPFPAWDNRGQVTASLDEAIVRLQRDREAVGGKLRELADAERQVGNIMLGSGILALIGAVSSSHADAVVAPAIVGGSAYTVGRYHDRTVPSQIYKQALQAYDCIEASVVPYRLGGAHSGLIERAVSDQGARKGLLEALGKTAGARANLAAHDPGNRLITQADAMIREGRETLNHVDAARQNVHELYALIHRLPAMVDERLASIRTVTDSALSDGQPKLDSIPALIADLPRAVASLQPQAGYREIIGPAVPRQAPGETTKGAPDRMAGLTESDAQGLADALRFAMTDLANAIHAADSNTRELAAVVGVVTAVASRDDHNRLILKTCGIGAQVLKALSLEPAELDFPAGKKRQTDIEIKGGTPPYVVSAYPPDRGTLTVGPSPNNGLFTVATDDKVAAQELEIRVIDAAGHSQKIKLHVR